MSFYELDRPAPSLSERLGALLARIGGFGSGLMTSFAYARMVRILSEMDDASLARIGIDRAGIPAHVDRCLRRG